MRHRSHGQPYLKTASPCASEWTKEAADWIALSGWQRACADRDCQQAEDRGSLRETHCTIVEMLQRSIESGRLREGLVVRWKSVKVPGRSGVFLVMFML